MKVNKKKVIILASLVVLLVATGVLNYFLNAKKAEGDGDVVTATPTFFATYREDREATRAEEILYLDSVISSTTADEETVTNAQNKKISICDNMETELVVEGLIKSKGFADCVVTISTDNVNVVVQDAELTLEESAQILNIIVTETSYTAPDVVIIPYA